MSGVRDPDRISAIQSDGCRIRTGGLHAMLADVAVAAASPAPQRGQRVAQALLPYLGCPDLLDDASTRCCPDRYVRHLIHRGADYTVLSLVWTSGQMSPVHAHRAWCAFGLHQGTLVESFFGPDMTGAASQGCLQHRVGDTGHSEPGQDGAHRLANLCIHKAVSIHVYGARYDRLGDGVNQIWAP